MTGSEDVREPKRPEEEMHDELLLNLARHHVDIESLLGTFFGFLERRTDFFHILDGEAIRLQGLTEGRSMGFREGRAAQMVCDAFSRAQERYRRRVQPHLLGRPLSFSQYRGRAGKGMAAFSAAAGSSLADGADQQTMSGDRSHDSLGAPTQLPGGAVRGSDTETKEEIQGSGPGGAEGNKLEKAGEKITTWNGGECGCYRWSQTFTDLTVQINLDRSKYQSKKDLSVVITPKKVKVTLAGEVLFQGEWHEAVNAAESFWQVEDGAFVLLSIEKGRENWWSAVLKGEQKIDTTKIESVKRVEDFDAATQAHIRKMMFDQQQKLKGEKTSEEIAKEELLRKAWNAEGSPFSGTPFDPSLVTLQGDFSPRDLLTES
ncbi:hypothetical protein CSUI_010940 [Cystoisospora suis]|uniref:Nuclear migration protein nudC n=1 Tax=Cystoisospora suis TaxID=483139 RepID=A0A2C6KDH6_9APIC|nr:hypothetical protein CSUI_010940 [Cystoisospora suis]